MNEREERKLLSIERLSKSYGRVRAVSEVDLVVRAGTVVGLVGPNGCGKTTTLSAATGLLRPDRGRALVCGHAQPSLAARRRTAFIPDEPTGMDELAISEYVELVGALWGVSGVFHDRATALLGAFGLAGRMGDALAALSHGQRRQVAAAAAFALATPLVVVDEATAALDPEAVVVLRETVLTVARGGAGILLATQDLGFAERTCDEICLLRRGQTIAAGPVPEILSRYGASTLEDAFLAALDLRRPLDELRDALASR